MKNKDLIKELALDDDALLRIKKSIQKAESETTGEIAVAVAAESSDYSFWELFVAVMVSLVVMLALLPLSGKVRAFYDAINWQTAPEWYLPAVYLLCGFCLIVVLFFLFNIPALDRIIIPSFYKNQAVTNRAMRTFTECGVYSTREHTGVLIFVSFLEHQVRIIADSGISQKVHDDLWKIIADGLSAEIKKKNIEGAFTDAIEKCAEILAQYFPADKNDNPDELDNGLIILT